MSQGNRAGPPIRAAIYAHLSAKSGDEQGIIESQIEFMRRYCELNDVEVHSIYCDTDPSDESPLHQRPAGKRLLADAASGAFSMVLVWRISCISERLQVLAEAHRDLEKASVGFKSMTEPIDTTTLMGRLLFRIISSVPGVDDKATMQVFPSGLAGEDDAAESIAEHLRGYATG